MAMAPRPAELEEPVSLEYYCRKYLFSHLFWRLNFLQVCKILLLKTPKVSFFLAVALSWFDLALESAAEMVPAALHQW